jgi:DNA sulfur modification protein DndD
MIINSLNITNIRNYVGSNNIDLGVSKNKNIILIGGNNGSGKTTLADAIRLCLYGHWVDGQILSEIKYQEYLDNICTKTGGQSSFSVSMKITMDEENPPVIVDIRRDFTKKGSKFEEKLTLRKGDSEVDIINENYWDYYIEKLIPPNVSRYFFFDGEKVRDTISSPNSREYLVDAINDLSGAKELENLKADLVEVKKKILSKTSQKASLQKISELQSNMDYHNGQVEKLELEYQKHKDILDTHLVQKIEVDQERSRVFGANESKKEYLARKLRTARQKYEELNTDITEFSHGRLIYKLAEKSLNRTIARAKLENSSVIGNYSIDLLQSIGSDVRKLVPGIKDEDAKAVIEAAIRSISMSNEVSHDIILDLTLPRISQMESMVVSNEEIWSFMEKFKEREDLWVEIQTYSKKMEKSDNSEIGEIDSILATINAEIESEKMEMSTLEGIKNGHLSQIGDIKAKIRIEEHSTVLVDVDRLSVDSIDSVIGAIESRVLLITSKACQSLSKRINEIYHILKNNQDMVKEIKIMDDFEIQLIGFKGENIDIKFISEGEKGILMYAVMYGLYGLSSSRFPVIIDSPVGRMDSRHVENLTKKLYPTVANQVLILSHDREITGDYRNMIVNNIAHQYLVSKSSTPKITEGYFE